MTKDDAAGPADDRALLAAWCRGDQRAGAQLFERHHESIARFFSYKVDPRAHDDVVQQTFLGLFEYAERFRGDASVRTLLFLIARRLLYAYFRGQSKDRERFEPGETSLAALDTSPSQAVAAREQLDLLNRALRELPLSTQLMVELHYWEDMPLKDIALILDMPEGTVRARMLRARHSLRAAIERLAESAEQRDDSLSDLSRWAARVRGELDAGDEDRAS